MGWIVDHPWWVIALTGAITLLFAAFIPGIKTEQDFREYLPRDDPAVQALEQAEERYGAQIFSLIAFEADDAVFQVSTLEKIKDLEDRIAEIPGVEEVQSLLTAQIITGTEAAITVGPAAPGGRVPETTEELAAYRDRVMGSRQLRGLFVSEDGQAAAIMFKLDPRLSTVETEEIARKVEAMAREYEGPERIYLAGGMFEALEAQRMMTRDLKVLLPVAVVMIVVVLYLSFRSLRGVVIPLVVVCLGVIWTVGAMAIAGVPFTVISIIIPVILLAMGTADGIHIVNRYYEVAARGRSKREVVLATMDEITSPVVMTSLTTIAGFLSLLATFLVPQRQFGVFTAVGMAALLLLSLTLIPALLSLLRLPATGTKEQQLEHGFLARGLARLGSGVVRHRAWVLAIAVVLVAISLVGVPRLRLETELSQYIGEDSPIAQTMQVMDDRFGGAMQLAIEIDTGRRDGLKDPEVLAKIAALEEFLEAEPAISTTSSIADMVREMNQKFHGDDPAYYVIPEDGRLVSQLLFLFTFQGGSLGSMALGDFSSGEVFARVQGIDSTQEIEELMERIQAYLDENFNVHGIRAQEVGIAQVSISLLNRLVASQATSLGTSMVAVWAIVALLMRSLLAGLISLIPLVITVALNFGFMAYTGRPLDIATMMIGSIVIGVGIDYAIHFQSRFRLEYARAKNPNPGRAIEQTMRTSGRGIVYNAVTVGLGFAVLVFSTLKGTAIFGSLIATAMGLSALAALTVIPALLATLRPRSITRGKGGPKRSDRKKGQQKGGRR
ncbi:MAG: efflux RND transporter permease subunit [Candidatus Bipolaricaulis anaerobius]|nr:efflux RND transporter permease subunit [Candidatus Bipolaricaulis anaerobius]